MGDLGSDELRRMQGLAQHVIATRPELINGDATVGELAWVWGKDVDRLGHSWRHRLWHEGGQLVGWGWARLPHRLERVDGSVREVAEAELVWQVRPDRSELLHEILDWYDQVAGDVERAFTVQVPDKRARDIAGEHGYQFDAEAGSDTGHWMRFNTRDLTEIPAPELPTGFRFVTAGDVSAADAVTAHRDAWPRSILTEAAFDRVRQTSPYRADQHLFVHAPDGTLAATAIVWLDVDTRTAEFEPVGTHHAYRRRGLGTALQLHGMRVARDAGAARMFVACLGAPAHPAAQSMYDGVGFQEITRDVPLVKPPG
ncbi:GNAT family N-acetyltransferase [Spiractinospora alimapuensis]|uniref:GNAT family N-acetyltransferase n=1 Tax=Spiractinospora alimapuensis TaxID=2820884 RepID=UPI001F3CFDE0|nr:GNAT family N-acetyltransferase [Spiractinospora alimapuensis]QVQ54388.1 GNAT family N-acetyltransferase [Spiractinospora alimapuensis]